jgi:KTSC domain
MERKPVASSNIHEAGYDPSTNTLELMFADGRVYQYFDVPAHVYEDLVNASSPGSFFHQEIRGTYRFARM